MRLGVRDRSIEVVEAVAGDLERHAAFRRLGLVETHPRDLGIGERRPRHHRVVGPEPPEPAEEGVHRRIPRLVRGGVGELEGTGHVAAREDVGIAGGEEVVGLDHPAPPRLDAELLETETTGARRPTDREEHVVELDLAPLPVRGLARDRLAVALAPELDRPMTGEHFDPVGPEALGDQLGELGVLARQQAIVGLDLGHLGAEPGEALGKLAADGAAAHHDETIGKAFEAPHRLRGEGAGLLDAGDRRHEGRRPGRDDDVAGGDGAVADPHREGGFDERLAAHAVDAEALVALDRVVRRDPLDVPAHPGHDLGEVEVRVRPPDPELARAGDVGEELRRADEALGRNATGVEAVSAHLVALDEGDPGPNRRADERGHEPRGAGPDHHEIAIEAPRAAVAAIDPPGAERVDDLLRDEGKDAEEEEGEPELRGEDPREALELAELRARVHVHQGAGKHPGPG